MLQYSVITARERSLGQGNIVAPVCHSVHGGSTWAGTPLTGGPPWQVHSSRYTPWQVHSLTGTPPAGTPPSRYTPQQVPPASTPPGMYTHQVHPQQVHTPGRHTAQQVHPLAGMPPPAIHTDIQSTSWWYASYWKGFLC